MFTVIVKQSERYCLCLLLVDIKRATSFEKLRTVDGTTYTTLKLAAIAKNLLEDDLGWN